MHSRKSGLAKGYNIYVEVDCSNTFYNLKEMFLLMPKFINFLKYSFIAFRMSSVSLNS